MKVMIDRENLINAVQTVQSVVSPRSSLPILNNILLQSTPTGLDFIATDLDTGIKTTIPVNLQEEGAITLPAKHFYEVIRELPDAKISLQAKKNNTVIIECGNSHFKLLGLPKDDFPKLPEIKDTHSIIINQPILKTMLNMCAFSMSHDETRYILNGVLFSIKEKEIKLVATDGRRLALVKYNLEQDNKLTKEVIVPAKAIQELNRTLGENEGELKISFGTNQVMFKIGPTNIVTRLIEGEFPNYEQVIPKASGNKIRVNKNELLQAIRRVSIFTTSESLSIKFDVSSNRLLITKTSAELGEAREELDIDYPGPELATGFNPYFLIDVLKNLAEDSVEIELTAADKPATIRSEKYLYLVLPMQL